MVSGAVHWLEVGSLALTSCMTYKVESTEYYVQYRIGYSMSHSVLKYELSVCLLCVYYDAQGGMQILFPAIILCMPLATLLHSSPVCSDICVCTIVKRAYLS